MTVRGIQRGRYLTTAPAELAPPTKRFKLKLGAIDKAQDSCPTTPA